MIEITANTRRAIVTNKELLTTGSAGIQVQFTLSEDWNGLVKLVVFRVGDEGESIDVALDSTLTCIVPSEVLVDNGEVLFIGIYGTNGDNTVIIPTIWASAGVIRPGTLPNSPSTPAPTPDIITQIQVIAQNAEETADAAMSLVEAGLYDLSTLEANVESAEAARVTAEQSRVTAENGRVTAENSRVNAETLRAQAEVQRAENETQRQNTESARQSAESLRVQAETRRAQAEEFRQANETSRASAESSRASAEQTRQTNESTRANNEAARVTAEQGRSSAETSRAQAESARASAETSRANAESSRATAEQNRASAETARTSAESARATAESTRASNEQSRVSAESARAQAETDRATEFATWESTIASKADQTEVDDLSRQISDVESALKEISVVPQLENGSVGNSGNTDGVCIRKYEITNFRTFLFKNHRPLDSGAVRYQYDVALYSNGVLYDYYTTGIADNEFQISRDEIIHYDNRNITHFGITIWEYDSSNNKIPLRISGFNTGDVVLSFLYLDKETKAEIDSIKGSLDAVQEKQTVFVEQINSPAISNGSSGNPANTDAVTARAIQIKNFNSFKFYNRRPLDSGAAKYTYDIGVFVGTSYYSHISDVQMGSDITVESILAEKSNATHFSITIWEYDSAGNKISLRATDFNYGDLIVVYNYIDASEIAAENATKAKVLNAKHVPHNQNVSVTTPLTILHFSDIHADSSAMERIISKSNIYSNKIDNMICTGDMAANTATQISSWWNKNIFTCIGNHDSASYNSDTGYNWTALSMADRDAYYIAPFESNWGITHTAGTSYYYKDYTAKKVRLIVMDVMLYNDNGAEATAQTSWLTNLLADAITNGLHVLIAIHAPHGGAKAIDCSFSKYGQVTMPVNADCNTPQAVIDVVSAKITAGLHFIGYLVGHTHQDNMWDTEDDGKQLMYCVTCAAVAQEAQWITSDQHRDVNADAFNLVTIDTNNTLVKIVRGGGADIDNLMRTRKAICFNYSTGQKVGEVL